MKGLAQQQTKCRIDLLTTLNRRQDIGALLARETSVLRRPRKKNGAELGLFSMKNVLMVAFCRNLEQ